MPRFLYWYGRLFLALVLPWVLLGCQLFSSAIPESDWTKHTLDTGPDVRVRIIRKAYFTGTAIEFPAKDVVLTDGNGQAISIPKQARKVYFRMQGDRVAVAWQRGKAAFKKAQTYQQVWIKTSNQQVRIFNVIVPECRFARAYDARRLNVSVKYRRLAIITTMPLEHYLAQVISEEMDPDHFTLEALKAQAVVARTWALKNIDRHDRFDYDYCDGPHCQVFKGRKRLSRRAERAVKMTLREVLMYNNQLAEAFYHSTCGGNTVFVNEVWAGRKIPYLVRVEDHWKLGNRPYCAQSPYVDWRIYTSVRRVERALRRIKKIGKQERLEDVQVDFTNRSGRVKRIRVITDKQNFVITSNDLRAALRQEYGKRKLLSNFYTLDVVGNQFRIVGHGLGHGVGMCQWGARGMAQHGFSYREILSHYFHGTHLGLNYGRETPVSSSEAVTQNSQAGEK
ncbi:SpoIID/LytB domain-containing protein [bacterium]|nr:SpoIID/LytB domain-containing protein [bacterium]